MMKIRQMLSLLFMMIWEINLWGQPSATYSIKGIIIEQETKVPVEFVNVSLFNSRDSSLFTGVVTDKNGEFLFNHIKAGNYYLQVSCIGFESFKIPDISIISKRPYIDLGKKTIKVSNILLSDVEVVSQKPVLDNSIDRKVYNVEKDILSQTGSVSDILQNIPSVSVDVDGTVSLRGSSNITFFINGKPSALLKKNSAVALQQIPANTIEQIEVITNPSAKYKPDGIGGIINIVLKKNKQKGFNGMIMANAGNMERYNANLTLNYNTGKLNVFGSYGFRRNNSPRTSSDFRISRDSAKNVLSYYDSRSTSASRPFTHLGNFGFEYQINDNNKVEISGNANFQDMYRTQNTATVWKDVGEVVTSDYSTRRINEESEMEWEAGALFEHKFNKEDHALQFEVNLSGYDETEDNHYTETYMIPADQEALTRILIKKGGPQSEFYVEYTLPVNEETEIEAGYVGEFFKDDLVYLGESFDGDLNTWLKDNNKSNHFIFHQNIHALYGTFSHSFDQLSFMAGLRAEQVFITSHLITLDSLVPNHYFKIYPTLHLAYELNDNQELQLNYSKRIRRPDSDEMNPFPEYGDPRNAESGNPAIKPEQIHSVEFGYHFKSEHYSIIPGIYYRYVYDAFTEIKKYINDTVLLTTFENLSQSQSAGMELVFSATFKNKLNLNISTNGYYSMIDASNLGYSDKKSTFSWDTKLGADIHISNSLLLQLNAYYRSARISAQGNSNPTFYVNTGLRQELLQHRTSVVLTVSDVFNTLNRVTIIDTPELYQKSSRKRNSQIIYLGFTYRFGKSAKKQTEELKYDDSI
jgi:outer membrane receptor protein involved in Fe transport